MEIFKCQYLLDTPTASLRSVVRTDVTWLHPAFTFYDPFFTLLLFSQYPLHLDPDLRLDHYSFYLTGSGLIYRFSHLFDSRKRFVKNRWEFCKNQILYILLYVYNLKIEESKMM